MEQQETKIYRTFEEFWPFYVSQHRLPQTRQWHFLGTTVFLTMFAVSFYYKIFSSFFFGIIGAYAFAWIGHFFCEHNTPATFKYPVYSLLGDFKMYYYMLIGRMDHEARQLNGSIPSDLE